MLDQTYSLNEPRFGRAASRLEAVDLERYDEAMVDDPAVEEWERHVAQFKIEGVDVDADDGGVPYMEEVWSFEP